MHTNLYNAEAWGLCSDLKTAATCLIISETSLIHVYLNNLSVAQVDGNIQNGLSQNAFKRFQDIAKSKQEKRKALTIQYIPSYSGLKKNEIANREAKKLAHYPYSPLVEEIHTL